MARIALILFGCWLAGAAMASHQIVQFGRSDYKIAVPFSASPAERYAAVELQTFLEQATGAKLPVVYETEVGFAPAIYVGSTSKAIKANLVAKAKKLGTDGVRIKSIEDDIAILGQNDRGTIYAVYVFLEKYLGVRFLARDCTIVPRKRNLNLPAIDHAYAPPFSYREVLAYDYAHFDFAFRQKLNGENMTQVLGRPEGAKPAPVPGVQIVPFVHSAAAMVPPSKYFATHPEYFGLVGGQRRPDTISGQLCYTNPDVLRICTEEALKYLAMSKSIAYVDVSQNDAWVGNWGACECERCHSVVKEEGAQSGTILRFVNAIADEVAKKYPDRFVETLAYQYSLTAPKVTKPRDNVVIRLCHHACYFHGIEGEELGAEFRKGVEDWARICKNVFVWHYGVNFWAYLAPNPNLQSLARDIVFYRRHRLRGLMLQANIQSAGGELAELRQYLFSQLVWDPSQNPVKLRQEFCKGYYGPASAEALKFLDMMDAWGRATKFHIPMNGWRPEEVTPPEFVASGLAVLDRAFEKVKGTVYANRVEKLMLPLWYMQLNWPDRYGLGGQGKTLTARARRLMEACNITTISEGPANAEAWLQSLEARYGKP